ncbi:helix-turn-helix domain-containing protein [Herpetosiphon llansteffanensis]|uniref:helix-turn-helix domain-containing protein n=1 Tax=Herpetosiphon llansteffanensis TaxID=2094568 RepID=UPI000D7C79C1|nr:helix-turn-helix transcriptional regulator [Herpetosiphon llansteffanensis]
MAIQIRLRQLLNDRDLSMYAVAKGTGLTYPTIYNLATKPIARIDIETIDKLCAFLQIQPGDLFVWVAQEHDVQQNRALE